MGSDLELVACYLGLASIGMRPRALSLVTVLRTHNGQQEQLHSVFPIVLRAGTFWRVS